MHICSNIVLKKDGIDLYDKNLLDAITYAMGKKLVGECTGSSVVQKAKINKYKDRIKCKGKFIFHAKRNWYKGHFSFCIHQCSTTSDGEPCYLFDSVEIDIFLDEI